MPWMREVPQPDGDCCLGGYCWRKYCPDKKSMQKWMMQEALRRDDANAEAQDLDIPEIHDEDRQ